MEAQDIIFDTRVDAKKMFVSVKTKFILRNYTNSQGRSPLYLFITGYNQRKRINLDLQFYQKNWDNKKQRLISVDEVSKSYNLILDNIDSKITSIKTTYYLTQKHLDVTLFMEEFIRGIPRVDFIAFADHCVEQQKSEFTVGTYNRHKSIIKKLKKFKPQIFFTEIDYNFILRLRAWMGKLGNKQTTIEGNITAVKKYLNMAKKSGIQFRLNIEDIKIGSRNGNRVDLKPAEVKRLLKYYNSEFINDTHFLVLGYFLFGCFTGLRISEIQSIPRREFTEGYFEFYEKKNKRFRRYTINKSLEKIIDKNEKLFVKKITDQKLNFYIKEVMLLCGIRKKISFHSARHTFATNFLRMGGDIISLKSLLGHSKIEMTMIYVHIVEQEVNEKVFIMDKLFE